MKKLSLLLLLAPLTLLSCGGNNDPVSDSGGDSGDSSSSVSPSGDTINVSFWHTFGQSAAAALESLAESFTELVRENEGLNVNITLGYQGGYDDILDKVTNSLSAGSTPTMAIAYPDHVANYLNASSSREYVVNLDDYIDDPEIGLGTQAYLGDEIDVGLDDFVEAFVEEGTSYTKEGTYSFPLMKSTEVMFYNEEMVSNAMKIYEPAKDYGNPADFVASLDWDGLLQFGEFCMQNKAQIGTNLTQAIWYDSDANLFISKMYQEEIPYASIVDGAGQIDFETGEARTRAEAMVQEIKDAYDAGYFITKGAKGTYGSDAFKNEEVIFEIGSSGGTGYNDPSGGVFTPGVAKVPASKGTDGNLNPLYVTQGPTLTFLKSSGISDEENARRMEVAWRFAKYITNAENNVYLCTYGSEGYVPVRYSAYDSARYQEYLNSGDDNLQVKSAKIVINEINGTYLTTPVFKGSAELREYCGGIITNFLVGGQGFENVTAAFSTAINSAKAYL